MLEVPYFKQDTPYSCGAVALQMVYAFFGKVHSEDALLAVLGTDRVKGTHNEDLIRVATRDGSFVYVNNESTLDEVGMFIEQQLPVIVNFIEPSQDDGHYAVIIDVTDSDIVFNDPWNGERFTMSHIDFLERWKSEFGNTERWIMVLNTEAFTIGKQYLPKE